MKKFIITFLSLFVLSLLAGPSVSFAACLSDDSASISVHPQCNILDPWNSRVPCWTPNPSGGDYVCQTNTDLSFFVGVQPPTDEACSGKENLDKALCDVGYVYIPLILSIVSGLVMIFFAWGLIKYLAGGTEKKSEARSQMIYSIMIMFVIFSIWGILALLDLSFGITNKVAPPVTVPVASLSESSGGADNSGSATCGGDKNFAWVVCIATNKILNPLIVLVVALALPSFVWSLGKYLKGDARSKEEAKPVILFSILAMFVMFSVWGIISVLRISFFGEEQGGGQEIPIPTRNP